MRVFRDLKYDDQSKLQNLDIYLPSEGDGPFPLIVFIHGGAWQFGDKNDGQENLWKGLVNQGYALASINYRLSDENSHYPDGIFDCKKALLYLDKHAKEYCLNMNEVAVVGNSAGGYYALMLATTVDNPKFALENNKDVDIKSCIALYAPTDFLKGKEIFKESLMNRIKYGVSLACTEKYFGKSINQLTDKELMEASPTHYINSNLPYILIQQGDNDYICPPEQADFFLEAANDKGVENRVTLEVFNGASHVDPMFETMGNKLRLKEFLDQHLKQNK